MNVKVGDTVRVRPNPEVDETLWDERGIVVDLDRDNRPIVELGGGADCAFTPAQLDLVSTADQQGPQTMGRPWGP